MGLAAILSVVTVGLWLTGRMDLYINPSSNWFAVGMAVLALVGTAASFMLPLGAEDDHGHDHGTAPAPKQKVVAHPAQVPAAVPAATPISDEPAVVPELPELDPSNYSSRAELRAARAELERKREVLAQRAAAAPPVAPELGAAVMPLHEHEHEHAEPGHAHGHGVRSAWGSLVAVTGGALATGFVALAILLPPASLSAELAISRDLGSAPLFGGEDVIQLASTGDLSSFGVGQWATVFATAPDPRAFEGTTINLQGFVAPASSGNPNELRLSRLVITHCVIDAQPAGLPVEAANWSSQYKTGQWVDVQGTVREGKDGKLIIEPQAVKPIPEPAQPYEF